MQKIWFWLLPLCFCLITESAYCDTNNFKLEPVNNKNNFVEQQNNKNKRYALDLTFEIKKKNNDLVKIPKVSTLNEQLFKNKIAKDNFEYQKTKKQLSEEQYQIYVIFDKLLRASNLQYQNWRIGINIDAKIVNASAGSANLITINSSLYDSLYQNEDAIAFIIAHELSHLILGHNQISLENNLKISEMEKQIQSLSYQAGEQRSLGNINSALGNNYAALGNSATGLVYQTSIASMNILINRIYAQERQLELDADIEALTLMLRAGYDPYKAHDALEFLSNLPNVYTNRSTHPDIKIRRQNIDEDLSIIDIANIKNQGRKNIYNSKPINCKKSSDKITLVLPAMRGYSKYKYIADTKENKFLKKAYTYYQNNDFNNAKKYFLNSYFINQKNFIAPLYLSYIEEYDFKVNRYKKSLKKAKYWAKKAYALNENDKYVVQQKEDIIILLKTIKDSRKNKKI